VVEEATLRDGRSAPSSGTSEASRLETSKPPDPLLVFFHGGGMIYGDLDSHDAMCRFLAEQGGVRVLAVDYRLGPEHPFPAGVDDAWAAYDWVSGNASDYGADPARLAVGGDSAGAYLAATTAIRAAQVKRRLAYQLLIYPVTDMEGKSESRRLFGRDHYLTHDFMEKATAGYLQGHDPRDPRASVLHADIPPGLAPAFVATAGFDPLRDEGEAYAEKLADAGVDVTMKRYGGEIHGFANIVGVDGHPRRAMTEMAHALADALDARLGASR
jgi:acetyl esterase